MGLVKVATALSNHYNCMANNIDAFTSTGSRSFLVIFSNSPGPPHELPVLASTVSSLTAS